MDDRAPHTDLRRLPQRYRLLLCDIWGCVHNGINVFPSAMALLETWRQQSCIVFLITNAPKPAAAVQLQLDRLGLSRSSYDAIITSGDTGIAALQAAGLTTVGFIGKDTDRTALWGTGLNLLPGAEGANVVCTGFPDGVVDAAEEEDVLRAMLDRRAQLHCFNPDRIVMRGEVLEPCAGAIAERYEEMGGMVAWYGKPYPPVYQRCLDLGSKLAERQVRPAEVVAIGDSLATDFVGAARAGIDFVFVTHGIEGQQVEALGSATLISRFAEEQGLDLPEPVAVVRELG